MGKETKHSVTYIRPAKGWSPLDLGEMARYRDLLFFLTWRDVKVKYKQAFLGVMWAILVPLTQMVIFGTIFGRVAKLPSDGINPYLFYLAGLIPWQYFAHSLTMASNSLVGSSSLLTKIYLPRIFIPLGACIAGFVDFAIAFTILLGLMLWLQVVPAVTAVLIPFLMLIAFNSALGVGLMLSALNVRYRDVRFVVPFLVQIWMYCSVIIPFSRIPAVWGSWRYLYGLNPMAGVVEGVRWCLMHHKMFATRTIETVVKGNQFPERVLEGQELAIRLSDTRAPQLILQETMKMPVAEPWPLIAIGAAVSVVLLVCGLFVFKRMEKMFADVV